MCAQWRHTCPAADVDHLFLRRFDMEIAERADSRNFIAGFRGEYGEGHIDWSLYDLNADPGESVNLIDPTRKLLIN